MAELSCRYASCSLALDGIHWWTPKYRLSRSESGDIFAGTIMHQVSYSTLWCLYWFIFEHQPRPYLVKVSLTSISQWLNSSSLQSEWRSSRCDGSVTRGLLIHATSLSLFHIPWKNMLNNNWSVVIVLLCTTSTRICYEGSSASGDLEPWNSYEFHLSVL